MVFVLLLTSILVPRNLRAQCAGSIITQTTTVGSNAGGGRSYTFTVPQYNPPTGYTLLAAVYTTTVGTATTLTLNNTTNQEQFFTPAISRQDVLKVNGTTIAASSQSQNDNDFPFTDMPATGSPGSIVTYGPEETFNKQQMVYDSITNAATLAATYTGTGNITLTYATSFFINDVPVGVTAASTIPDTVKVKLTYYICLPYILAANFLNFTATKQDATHTLLNWAVVNEEPGRTYVVEVSPGGTDFVDVASMPSSTQGSNADYSYTYSNQPNATGKLYFRIKQLDVNGQASYSNICVVDLGNTAGASFTIFPNPAVSGNFISLTLPGDNRSWQIDIFSADGNLVQRSVFANTSLATVNFNQKMAAGTYFVRAMNPLSGDSHTGSFIVHP